MGRRKRLRGLLLIIIEAGLLFSLAVSEAEHGAPYVAEVNGMGVLLSANGDVLASSEEIQSIFAVREGSLYAAGRTGDYWLMDASGNAIGETRFSMIDDMGGALVFRQEGLYGAMDQAGVMMVEPAWRALVYNGADGFLALGNEALSDQGASEVYCVKPGEDPAPTDSFTMNGLRSIRDERMPYMGAGGMYGCLGPDGSVAIPCTFDWIGEFCGGTAIAARDGRYGIIDVHGEWITAPQYAWLDRGAEMAAGLTETGILDAWSLQGKPLFSIQTNASDVALVGDYLILWEEGDASVYNAKGRCIYEAASSAVFAPGVNGQLIVSDGKWGSECTWLMNPNGTSIERRFQHILPLCGDRYAFVTLEGVEYFSSDFDSPQTSWNYDSVRYGLMDGAGQAILPAEYLEIRALGEDRLLLVGEQAVSFVDLDGNPLRTWRG